MRDRALYGNLEAFRTEAKHTKYQGKLGPQERLVVFAVQTRGRWGKEFLEFLKELKPYTSVHQGYEDKQAIHRLKTRLACVYRNALLSSLDTRHRKFLR